MANEVDSKIIIRENNLGDGLEFDINNKVNLKLGENSPIKITDGVIDNNVSLDYDPDGKTISLISGEQILPLPIDNLASTVEVEESIISAVENLDVDDDAVEHEFVTAVSETDGKISVTRSVLTADDMPSDIPTNKISSVLGNPNLTADINDLDTEISGHTADTSNPHAVTKAQVGLGNVDNTSDADKPISTATQNALNGKVDVVSGKQLSTEDFTTDLKTKLDGIDSGAQVNAIESVKVNNTALTIDSSDKSVNIDLSDYAVKTALRTAINTQLGLASDNTNIDLNTSDKIKNVLGAICKSLGFNLVEPTE